MKLILDMDTGIDDALALAYVLGKQAQLLGVTSVYGTTNVQHVTHNHLALLQLLGHPEIPVFQGAASATSDSPYQQKRGGKIFHGSNGLAALDLSAAGSAEELSAVDFLLHACHQHASDLTIIATGPVTNLAQACQKDPAALRSVGQIILMGGALCVPGNVSPFAEANISQDAAGADLLFHSDLPLTMVGLDVTLRSLLTYEDIAHWQHGNPKQQSYYALVDFYLQAHQQISPHLGGCALHDPLAAAAAFEPALLQTIPLYLKVLTDETQLGRTVVDQAAMNGAAENRLLFTAAKGTARKTHVAIDVRANAFKREFLASITESLQ